MQIRWNVANLALPFLALLSLAPMAFAQSVTLSRSSVSFGNQATGRAGTAQNVILTNPGTIPLSIASIVASGGYAETDDCNGSVAPASACTVKITFNPQIPGAVTGALTVTDDANTSPQLIALTGTGIAPLTFTPATLAFGTVAVGSTSPTKVITVTNALTTPLTLKFAASGGYIASAGGATPCTGSLASKAACTISVKLKPTTAGEIDGALTLTQNINSTAQIVNFSGAGSGGSTPPLTFSPATVSFGSVGIGIATPKTIFVSNKSSKAINISAFTANGTYTAVGGASSPCGGSLKPNNQCSVLITFKPSALGLNNGALSITDDSSVPTQTLDLTGTGIPALQLSTTTLTFPSQQQGAASAPQTVTVTNHLKSNVTLSSIVASGDYSATNSCGGTIAASGTCTISVSFNPIARTGTISGSLTIVSNTTSSPLVVALTGASTGTLPRFAYVANSSDSTISTYALDLPTGQLRNTGYTVSGSYPAAVAVTPSNKFAYVIHQDTLDIAGYSINAVNGQLTLIGTNTFGPDSTPLAMGIAPSGGFVYVAGVDSTMSGFAVNAKSGALTAVSGSPFTTGNLPIAISFTPASTFAYVVNLVGNSVSAYKVNATTGGLKEISGSPFATGSAPYAMVIDPAGKFAYVANSGDSTVSAFQINASTGSLSPVAGSPFPAGVNLFALSMDHAGKFVFVCGTTASGGAISVLAINPASGVLTAVPGSPFAQGGDPRALTVDATNQFLFVTDHAHSNVQTYAINGASGALTLLKSAPAWTTPNSIAMVNGATPVSFEPRFFYVPLFNLKSIDAFTIDPLKGSLAAVAGSPFAVNAFALGIAVDPAERFAFVLDNPTPGSNAVVSNSIDPTTGALTTLSGSTTPVGGTETDSVVDPSGRFLYVAERATGTTSGQTSVYAIGSTGSLMPIPGSPFVDANDPIGVTLDPSGRFLFVADSSTDTGSGTGFISSYTVSPFTGALTAVGSSLPTGHESNAVAAHPSGRFVYVPNVNDSTVSAFAVDPASGTLTEISGSPFATGKQPYTAGMDPFGRFLYIGNYLDETISVFSVNPSTGALLQVSGSPFLVGGLTNFISVDPAGRFIYVANASNAISTFAVNSSTGTLTQVGSPLLVQDTIYKMALTGIIH